MAHKHSSTMKQPQTSYFIFEPVSHEVAQPGLELGPPGPQPPEWLELQTCSTSAGPYAFLFHKETQGWRQTGDQKAGQVALNIQDSKGHGSVEGCSCPWPESSPSTTQAAARMQWEVGPSSPSLYRVQSLDTSGLGETSDLICKGNVAQDL